MIEGKIVSAEDYLIRFYATTDEEREIFSEYFNHGIRSVSLGGSSLTISSPRTANVTEYFLSIEERKLLMKALVTYKKSTLEERLVKKLLLELIE